jgi:DNA-directed RNA polymerase subunit beta
VPFLHHDAAEIGARCVANIHDALPSLHPEAPRVATGLEAEIAHASGLAIHAPEAGLVRSATAREILLETPSGLRAFPLRSFDFAPRGAHVRQRPAVRAGQRVEPGELLATGPGVVSGELAVGHNLLVALVSGVTLGSSLMISERVLQRGQFTSLRLREYRLFLSSGTHEESFCAEIPGLDEDERAHLDEHGLARIGARVRGGEVLVGRTRRGFSFAEDEAPPPEDTSLRLPAGREGVVIGARILRRREAVMPRKAQALARVLVAELCPLEAGDLLGSRHGDRGTVARLVPVEDMPLLPDGTPVDLLLNPASVLESGAAGLLMETLAGALGVPVVAPPFAPITERQLRARGGGDGRIQLRDGMTGEPFAEPVTVGNLYLMKLPPLVREVQEVRSTGPTDPLTDLPVEGQGSAPGQLLDEDAVAALMAHGAAFTLREMMTGKGDAPEGREALLRMIRDHEEPTDHVTRGLDALIRELRAAALEIQAGEGDPAVAPPPAPPEPPPPEPPRTRKRRRRLQEGGPVSPTGGRGGRRGGPRGREACRGARRCGTRWAAPRSGWRRRPRGYGRTHGAAGAGRGPPGAAPRSRRGGRGRCDQGCPGEGRG